MSRNCGVLMPVFSLPSRRGIGSLGKPARRFIEFLGAAGQSRWQMLPLVPAGAGNSPYSAFSTFAGDPAFIDIDDLVLRGLLTPDEAAQPEDAGGRVDYAALSLIRPRLLRAACRRLAPDDPEYLDFKEKNSGWLGDFALFTALRQAHRGLDWTKWEAPVRDRDPAALARARDDLRDETELVQAEQFLFFSQYAGLRACAAKHGVKLIGDIPIYVSADSADVWSNAELFDMKGGKAPKMVAGVPPDYFSATGQLWGNPVYDWAARGPALQKWWLGRLRHGFEMYDTVRIDHFRGFDEYYAIPAGAKTAAGGHWEKGPGLGFFDEMRAQLGRLDIIAEDLGDISDSVRRLLRDTGFPGMRVLQFGLRAREDSLHLPHNYIQNCAAYTGTHDNDTIMGWFDSAPEEDRLFAADYLRAASREDFAAAAVSAVYASPASLAVIPMQDWLGLGAQARMNIPATASGNWSWRCPQGALTDELAARMRHVAGVYRRG